MSGHLAAAGGARWPALQPAVRAARLGELGRAPSCPGERTLSALRSRFAGAHSPADVELRFGWAVSYTTAEPGQVRFSDQLLLLEVYDAADLVWMLRLAQARASGDTRDPDEVRRGQQMVDLEVAVRRTYDSALASLAARYGVRRDTRLPAARVPSSTIEHVLRHRGVMGLGDFMRVARADLDFAEAARWDL